MSPIKPFLTKRKRSKYWYIITTNPATKKRSYKSTGTANKVEAEILLREVENSLGFLSQGTKDKEQVKKIITHSTEHASNMIIQSKTPLTVIWQEYQKNERVRALKPYTLRNNKVILEAFIRFLAGSGVDYVEQIAYENARAYLDSMRANKRSDRTLTNHRHCLHGIFSRVKRPLHLQANPFEDVEAPFRPKGDTHRCFTTEELTKVLNAVDNDWKMLISLSYFTGLRFGDCCFFKMECIQWEQSLMLVKEEKNERFDKPPLVIPLHPTLRRLLQEYSNALTGYLFPHFAELKRKESSYFCSKFGKTLKGLGIPRKTSEGILDFHSLRHTFNTNLANGDVDVATRMKLTGHSSIEVNQIYNHAMEPLRKAIRCIPEMGDTQQK